MMRDAAALEAYMQSILDAYPTYMAAYLARTGLTVDQWRTAPEILMCLEQLGDLAATAQLDQLEASAATWRTCELEGVKA